jgi:hypothetical protein
MRIIVQGGGVGWARRLLFAITAHVVLAGNQAALGAAPDQARFKATTSRAARDEAVRAIPFSKLKPEARAKANGVVQNLSLYRRLPTQIIECDAELFAFLERHPEVVVNLWQVMGITRMELDRLDRARYKVSDGEGTKGRMEYLYTAGGVSLIYSDGTYDGPLYPRTVRGKCLMLLRTWYEPAESGRTTVVSQLDTFLAVENLGVEVLAKTFQPLIGKAADHNFTETANFVANLSQTAETNEEGLLRLGRKLNRIDPATREQFLARISAVPQKLAAAGQEQADTEVVATRRRGAGE